MSSQFQGYAQADGKIRTTTGPATHFHRGMAVAGDAVVAIDHTAEEIKWVGGVALDKATGALLLSSAPIVGVAPGGLAVDAKGVISKGSTVAVIHQGVGLEGPGDLVSGESLKYLFDGVNDYASMPAWRPSSQNFQVSAQVIDGSGAFGARYIVGDDNAESFFGRLGTGNQDMGATFRYAPTNAESVGSLHQPTLDEQFTPVMNSNATRVRVTSAGFSQDSVNAWEQANPANEYVVIGAALTAGVTPVSFWNGYIWDLHLTDYDNPSNSRHYPMNEGMGSTFVDVLGGNNATIQNYNAGNWQAP